MWTHTRNETTGKEPMTFKCNRDNNCQHTISVLKEHNDQFPKNPNYKPPPKKKFKPAKNELDGIRNMSKVGKLSEKEKEFIKLEKFGTPLEYFTALKVIQACFYKEDSTWFGWHDKDEKPYVKRILSGRLEREFIYKIQDPRGKEFGFDYFTGIRFSKEKFIISNELFGDLRGFNRFINKRSPNINSNIDNKCFSSFNELVKSREVPEVEKAVKNGYLGKDSYLFPYFMISDGELYPKEESYPWIKNKNILPVSDESFLKEIDEYGDFHKVVRLIYEAWGPKGVLTLGFCVANYFVDQLEKQPSVSLNGERNSGKTLLAETVMMATNFTISDIPNKVTGANSRAGTMRRMVPKNQLTHYISESNLAGPRDVFILTEDQLLLSFDKRLKYIKGKKTDGHEVYEEEINGGFLFAQNNEFWSRPANKERIISFPFSKKDHTKKTRQATDQIKQMKPEELASLGFRVLTKSEEIREGLPEIIKEVQEIFSHLLERQFQAHGFALIGVKILEKHLGIMEYPVTDFCLSIAEGNFKDADTANDEIEEIIELMVQDQNEIYIRKLTQVVECPGEGQNMVYFNLTLFLQGHPREREIKRQFKAIGTHENKWFKAFKKGVRSFGLKESIIPKDNLNAILRAHGKSLKVVK